MLESYFACRQLNVRRENSIRTVAASRFSVVVSLNKALVYCMTSCVLCACVATQGDRAAEKSVVKLTDTTQSPTSQNSQRLLSNTFNTRAISSADNSPAARLDRRANQARTTKHPNATGSHRVAQLTGSDAGLTINQQVARDFVIALVQIDQRSLSAKEQPKIQLAFPQNDFERAILRELQFAGYTIHEASQQRRADTLHYRVSEIAANTTVSSSRNDLNVPAATDQGAYYRFEYEFGEHLLSRSYRLHQHRVHPLGPMLWLDSQHNVKGVITTDPLVFDG